MSNHLTDEQLINYAYRTLADTQREMANFHLTRCPQCRERLAEHETLQRRIRYSIMARRRQLSPSTQMTFVAIAPRLKRSRRLIMFWKQSNQLLYGAVTIVVLVILAVGLIALLGNIGINLPLPTTEGNEANQISLTGAPLPDYGRKERVNILLLGIDQLSVKVPARTDTMILTTIDPNSKTAGMLSIPRDLWVTIPGYGENRINQAFFFGEQDGYPGGGPALAMKTVQDHLGIPVHFYILVDFEGFQEIVDTLGGIDIDVPTTINDPTYPGNNSDYDPFYIEAGQHTLDGYTALRYARTRATLGADFARARRQQQVLLAIRDKALQLDMIPQIPELWNTLAGTVETDLQLADVVALAQLANEINTGSIQTAVIDTNMAVDHVIPETGARVLLPLHEKIRGLVNEMFAEGESVAGPAQTEIAPPLPTTTGQTSASQPATYVVQPGDTLPMIAEKFGISIEDLIAKNPNLGLLQAGQELIISVEKPTPSPLPPPPVGSMDVSFSYGIQADPRGDTEANIKHIKTLGFEWVKFQMPWKEVEPAPGDNYVWMRWDEVIDAYVSNDVKIMLSIVKAPDWARPADDDKSVEGLPANPANYANFVAQVAARYQGKVQAIEIWKEQNLWYVTGGRGRIDSAVYVELLQQAYLAIKSVNPDMIVISGGLSPAGNVGDPDQGGNLAIDDIEYLEQMYELGAKGYFDALGAHPSGYNCPALADWQTVEDSTTGFDGPFRVRHHSWCFLGTMEGYREVMVANGDGDTPIAPTEFGWGVSSIPEQGYEFTRDNTYEEQAQWIVEAYQWAKEQGWVGPMFLWNLDYGVTAPSTELASFGILDTPAYDALVNMPK